MLNIKVTSFSYFVLGFVMIGMLDFTETSYLGGGDYSYGGYRYGSDYDYINGYNDGRHNNDDDDDDDDNDSYNNSNKEDDTEEEEEEEEDDKPEDGKPEERDKRKYFNLEEGREALFEILFDIEKNYLPDDAEVSWAGIEKAKNLDSLITAGNHCLTEEQDEELLSMSRQFRVELNNKLVHFLNDFREKLTSTGNGNCIAPLSYLYTRLKQSFN